MHTQKQLARFLSQLTRITGVDRGLEQYQTEGDIAAEILWNASLIQDLENSTVVDCGCGNGIFGIGAFVMGASKLVLIDKDEKAISLARQNIDDLKGSEFQDLDFTQIQLIQDNIKHLPSTFLDPKQGKVVTIMNPPFGTKKKHADREFLEKAFSFSDVVYSMHLAETLEFLKGYASEFDFLVERGWKYQFRIPKSHEKHKKKNHFVDVICLRYVKQAGSVERM